MCQFSPSVGMPGRLLVVTEELIDPWAKKCPLLCSNFNVKVALGDAAVRAAVGQILRSSSERTLRVEVALPLDLNASAHAIHQAASPLSRWSILRRKKKTRQRTLANFEAVRRYMVPIEVGPAYCGDGLIILRNYGRREPQWTALGFVRFACCWDCRSRSGENLIRLPDQGEPAPT